MIKTEVKMTNRFGEVFQTVCDTDNVEKAIEEAKQKYGKYTRDIKIETNYVIAKEN